MNTIAISVILPVYNVEPYLSQCIDSLKDQTFKDLEFIFVDDGSSDTSLQLIESFQKEDSRVHIIRNEKNEGPGFARNKGIKIAQGQYLSFIDPDDWLDIHFYEYLYQKALQTKVDIIKGIRLSLNEAGEIKNKPYALNDKIQKRKRTLSNIFTYEHTCAIYKRDLFVKDSSIRYGSGYYAEDTTFLLRLCLKTQKIAIENNAIYYYRFHNQSLTKTYTMKRCNEELHALEEKIDAISALTIDDKTVLTFAHKIYTMCLRFFLADGSLEEQKEWISLLKRQIYRIPRWKLLETKHTFIHALVHYDTFLPHYEKDGNICPLDCLQVWCSFIHKHPHLGWKYQIEFTDLFLYSLLQDRKHTLSTLSKIQKIRCLFFSIYRIPRLVVKHILERA